MTRAELVQFLKEKTGWSRDLGAPRDIICRCPFCGDSVKHKNKGHLYINLDLGVYHCFRCTESGPASYLFKLLECNVELPKTTIQKPSISVPKGLNYILPEIDFSKDKHKYEYLIKRDVDPDDDVKFRIIWNLDDFVRANSLDHIRNSINMSLYQFLTTASIGFLSYFGYYIIFRTISQECSFKYFKLPLNQNHVYDYYMIENYAKPDWPTIVAAEGPFDAIHSYYKLRRNFAVYIAASSQYIRHAIQFAMLAFGFTYPDIVVVFDKDTKKKPVHLPARSITYLEPVDGKDIAECEQLCEVKL